MVRPSELAEIGGSRVVSRLLRIVNNGLFMQILLDKRVPFCANGARSQAPRIGGALAVPTNFF